MKKNPLGGFKNPLSSGLGRNGRIASWAVAIVAVAGYSYYESRSTSSTVFSKEEQQLWNVKKRLDGKDDK